MDTPVFGDLRKTYPLSSPHVKPVLFSAPTPAVTCFAGVDGREKLGACACVLDKIRQNQGEYCCLTAEIWAAIGRAGYVHAKEWKSCEI